MPEYNYDGNFITLLDTSRAAGMPNPKGKAPVKPPLPWPLPTLARADKAVSSRLFLNATGNTRRVLKLLELLGDGLLWIPLGCIAFALREPPYFEDYRVCIYHLLIGFVLDLLIIGLLKALVQRKRPSYNNMADMNLVVGVDKFSFPSGHSSRAVFIGGMAWTCVRSHWRGFIVLWATSTASSRVLLGRHYVGDVVAGTLVGLAMTAFMTAAAFDDARLWIPMPASLQ